MAVCKQLKGAYEASSVDRRRKTLDGFVFSSFNARFDWFSRRLVANQLRPGMEEGINARWLLI